MQTSADSSKPQHTPGPWRKIKGTGVIAAADCHVAKVGDFTDAELLPFNRERWEADGDFIIRACNSYAALVEALKKAARFVDKASGTALGIAMSGRHHPNPDEVLTDLSEEGLELSESLRAALASAKES